MTGEALDDKSYLKLLGITIEPERVRRAVSLFEQGKTRYFVYTEKQRGTNDRLVAKHSAEKIRKLLKLGKLDRFKSQDASADRGIVSAQPTDSDRIKATTPRPVKLGSAFPRIALPVGRGERRFPVR